MYSRPLKQDMRIPPNYGGSMFGGRTPPPTPVEDLTHRRPSPPPPTPQAPPIPQPPTHEEFSSAECERCEECRECEARQCTEAAPPCKSNKSSIFAPFGALGSEELLLIALALIIFQNGSDPELALILLALLFIN